MDPSSKLPGDAQVHHLQAETCRVGGRLGFQGGALDPVEMQVFALDAPHQINPAAAFAQGAMLARIADQLLDDLGHGNRRLRQQSDRRPLAANRRIDTARDSIDQLSQISATPLGLGKRLMSQCQSTDPP